MSAADLKGVQLLLVNLFGVKNLRGEHWTALCPAHEDKRPSLDIKVKENQDGRRDVFAFCHSCGAKLPKVCETLGIEQWRVRSVNLSAELDPRERRAIAVKAGPLPSAAQIEHWFCELLDDDDALDFLRVFRGLPLRLIEHHQLGIDGKYFVLPVFDSDGVLVNVRRYRPGHHWLGVRGRSIQLYPDLPDNGRLVVCEGEMDALVGRARGMRTVTTTGGARGWKDEWLAGPFSGRRIAIIFDCDAVGRTAAADLARRLIPHAELVKIVDLGLGEGEDLTDWFVRYGRTRRELYELIKKTPRYRNGR